MNKSSISGWKDVLSFTFLQTMKSKSFIVSYVIFILIATLSIPVISLLTSNGTNKGDQPSPIQKVYVDNRTDLPEMDFTELQNTNTFRNTAAVTMSEDYDTVSKRIEDSENTSVILTISNTDGVYSLSFVKASSGPVGEGALSALGNELSKQFEANKIKALGITSDQVAMLNAKVDTKVTLLDTDGNPVVKENTTITFSEYWFIYGLWFIVFMVNSIASAQIATSIVTEKSTRVMEYLLISVKPLALIIGKIIAMLSAALLEMVSLVVMVFLSSKVSAAVISGGGEDILSKYLPSNVFDNLNLFNIIMCIAFVLLGLIFYATLAGLAGSTVSRLEELQEGLTLFTFTSIIGAYIGIAAIGTLMGAGNNPFVTFAFLFPLSSPFLIPGALLVGKVSLPIAAGSFALLIVSNILLLRFTAKVFETLILHTGNKIKIKDLVKISKYRTN